jgi:hypothetical protein
MRRSVSSILKFHPFRIINGLLPHITTNSFYFSSTIAHMGNLLTFTETMRHLSIYSHRIEMLGNFTGNLRPRHQQQMRHG